MAGQVIRMGGYKGPQTVTSRAAYFLGEQLEETTGGEVTLTLIDDVTALGRNAMDLIDMVEGSELDMCYFPSSYLAHRVPNLAVFDLPFSIDRREAMYDLVDRDLGAEIKADIENRTGFVLLGFWDNGFRHFTNRLHPIHTPEDCRGLSIRTTNSAVHQDIFRALGFQPDFIDIRDFPTAVRNETVDAQENGIANTVNLAIHETHRYMTMSGHFCGVSLVLGNADKMASWSKDTRDALRDSMIAATAAQRDFAREADAQCFSILEETGVKFVGPDDFDRSAFVAATAAVSEATAAAIDESVMRYFRQ